jgi:alkanesulfonate monooxygenase SsuD/methylene tetrahydromethanopterin reductase-like flavin-dependent oxidoreductase (luciferase family)
MTLPSMVRPYSRQTTLDWCARIDAGPYVSVSVGERINFHNQAQLVLLSAAAALTQRVRVISTITILPMHPAALIAKQAATLDVLCQGRLVLGVGVGARELDYVSAGASFTRRHQRLDDMVAEVRQLWRGEPPIPGADSVGPLPVRPGGPPIYSSSFGPASLARSSRWADGYVGFTPAANPAELSAVVGTVRQAWRDAQRIEKPYLITSFWFSLGPDAVERQRAYVADYMAYDTARQPVMREAATITSPDAVRAAIDAAGEAGFDEVMFIPTTSDVDELDRLEPLL